MNNLRVVLGYDNGIARIEELTNIFIGGSQGSGKSSYIKSLVGSLSYLNDPSIFDIKVYTKTSNPVSINNLTVTSLEALKSDEDPNPNILHELELTVRERRQHIKACNVKPGEFKPIVFVYDSVYANSDDCTAANIIMEALVYSSQINVHLIFADYVGVEWEEPIINIFPVRIALSCDSNTSKRLVKTTIAASNDFRNRWKMAMIKIGDDKPVSFSIPKPIEDQIEDLKKVINWR
jgi:hypothetical protein